MSSKIETIVLAGVESTSAEDQDTLFQTFEARLDHDASIPETAEALHCHPNTVRYRLRRIEQLSGRSFKVPRELAELCLAVEIHPRRP